MDDLDKLALEIGDKVRCLEAAGTILKVGAIYTVARIEPRPTYPKHDMLLFKEVPERHGGYFFNRFQRLNPAYADWE
jgi:hypothetical protein